MPNMKPKTSSSQVESPKTHPLTNRRRCRHTSHRHTPMLYMLTPKFPATPTPYSIFYINNPHFTISRHTEIPINPRENSREVFWENVIGKASWEFGYFHKHFALLNVTRRYVWALATLKGPAHAFWWIAWHHLWSGGSCLPDVISSYTWPQKYATSLKE